MADGDMTSGTIFKIQKYALHDGPGIRTTVFLKGCPLSCWWCHNPEGISPDPQPVGGETAGRRVTAAQVLAEVEKDVIFYDESDGGATFSGGEPTLQPQFLEALLAGCRRAGIHTALDTCGHAPPERFACLAGAADLVLFDLKPMNPGAHRRFTGSGNDLIHENFRALCRAGRPLRVRVPLLPGITDTSANIAAVAAFVRACGGPRCIDLLPFHRTAAQKYRRLSQVDRMAGTAPPGAADIERVRRQLREEGFDTQLGG